MTPAELSAIAVAGATMGLLGSTHCVGMCGGIAAAVSPPSSGGRPGVASMAGQLRLATGRIASYALLGTIVGGFGWAFGESLGQRGVLMLRVAFGALMAIVGLSIAGWLSGLGPLEAVGARAWQRISPLLGRLLPADTAWKQLAAGAVWGWLPCGLVYAALAGAASAGSTVGGALMMTSFGLGTLPAVAGVGLLADRMSGWVRARGTRRFAGATLIVFGLWTALGPLWMAMNRAAGGGGHVH